MYAIIAFIPIIVTVIVMAGLNWPAKRALDHFHHLRDRMEDAFHHSLSAYHKRHAYFPGYDLRHPGCHPHHEHHEAVRRHEHDQPDVHDDQ